jgi:hypothetical protein
MKKILSLLMMVSIASTFIFADNFDSLFEDTSIMDDESLFAGDDLFDDSLFETEEQSQSSNLNLFDDLLTGGAEISGSYSFTFKTGLTYDLDGVDDIKSFSTTDISTDINLSARPSTDTRFYIGASLQYPFEDDDSTDYSFFNVDELFYDFVVDDYFVRVGKQTLNMGVGYFYSPANLLNISTINPLSPEDDQEGPVAIKVNRPIGNDNIYAYLTFPDDTDYSPEDIGYAARLEKVVGDGEYSLSGFYSYDQAESPTKIAATGSTSLFPDVDIIAEAVESYDGDDFYFEGTAGIQVLKDLENLSDTSLSFIAQYYYNQNGVSTFGFDASHQLAAVLSLSVDDMSYSLTSVNVLSETTGVLLGNIWYDMNDDISLNLGASYYYGASNYLQPYIGITLGEGDF